MSSEVEICNRALSEIGTRSTITSLAEASAEAQQCNLWYDQLRKMLLRSAPWGFARAQYPLSELGSLTTVPPSSPWPWGHKFMYPTDCLRMRYILPPAPSDTAVSPLIDIYCGPSPTNRFIIANDKDSLGDMRRVILSNVPNAQAVYIIDVSDVSLFDDAFNTALSAALSFKLCIPLSGNVAMRQDFRQTAEDLIKSARAADGNEGLTTTEHTPDWILARGSPDVFAFPDFNLGMWYWGFDQFGWGN